MVNVLALSGSLRRASINSALLRAAARIAQPPLRITVFGSLGALPLFNPDLEESLPEPVAVLRRAIGVADALMIATPEYAHGVSGPMKNALDWLVSDEGFVAKPVALLNASPRAHHAHDALLETLNTMSARVLREACVVLPLLGSGLDEESMTRDAATVEAIRGALGHLQAALAQGAAAGPAFPI
jgi:chromate reductase, NAD(P)H dehydrogenase (quinone)